MDSPISAKEKIRFELDKIFDLYNHAITEQLEWTKGMQSSLKSLELDFMQDGMDIYENERATERLEQMRSMFETSSLKKQLKKLETLKGKMLASIEDIFKSIS